MPFPSLLGNVVSVGLLNQASYLQSMARTRLTSCAKVGGVGRDLNSNKRPLFFVVVNREFTSLNYL